MFYAASLLFTSDHKIKTDDEPLCEERIVLIEALDRATAMAEAEKIGKKSEHEYEVVEPKGDTVRWEFNGVMDLYEPGELAFKSGVELFSRFISQSLAVRIRNREL